MAPITPRLDDRSFEDLVRESKSLIAARCPGWTDLGPSDPGVVLLDAGVTAEALRQHQAEETRGRIQADLDSRRPMVTRVVVSWTRFKKVAIQATLLAHRSADPVALRARLLSRLHRYVDPLPAGDAQGWGFGEPLPSSNIYYLLQSEPGVLRVDQMRLMLEEVPGAARAIAADSFQPDTWYAADGPILYRSGNDGEGWEVVGRFPGEVIDGIEPHPSRPGLLAISARLPSTGAEGQSRLHFSWDCAETWDPATYVLPAVEDLAWLCVRSWRFGNDHLPCGGIGAREALWDAYEKAGGRPVNAETARWWEVFGNVKWGVICISQAATALNEVTRKALSPGRALELAAIGRRTAETEWELLNLMEGTA